MMKQGIWGRLGLAGIGIAAFVAAIFHAETIYDAGKNVGQSLGDAAQRSDREDSFFGDWWWAMALFILVLPGVSFARSGEQSRTERRVLMGLTVLLIGFFLGSGAAHFFKP